ncbi:MAG TPA: DUF2147 domain-containing protein [Smithellaceae bacterium]|nr:DUF2147 domain-containing protein [Smithellaceae bacterium]
MKKILIAFLALLLVASFLPAGHAADPSIAGVWSLPVLKGKDKGKERFQVEIFEKDGVYYGKIVKLTSLPENALCTKCKKERKDKPLMGMLMLWNLKKEAGRYVEGKIYDVEAGKEYKCSIVQITPDRLKITASVLFLSESHYWTRVK